MTRTLEEWRDHLLPRLASRIPQNALLRQMYDGDHPMPTAPSQITDKYRRLAQMSITNMCGLVVDAPTSKLTPKDVRLSEDGDEDLDLWRQVWKANKLNARAPVAHEEALKVGRSAALVWPRYGDNDEVTGVSVTVEDADQVIVAYAPGSTYDRVAALKWYCEDGHDYVTVWTPQEVFSWYRVSAYDPNTQPASAITGSSTEWQTQSTMLPTTGGDWEIDEDMPGGTNPLGRVPVVEFLCKPNAKGVPTPEINLGVLRLQTVINKTKFDIVVAGEDGAYPQRVMVGIDVKAGDLVAGPNRVWSVQSQDPQNPSNGSIQEFTAYDTSGLLNFLNDNIRQLGWVSRTSAIFMLGGSSNVGADMIRALDDGHRAKVVAHQIVFGEAWEEVFLLALLALSKPAPPEIEIGWVSPEFKSPAEMADAAIKLRSVGYSFRAIARYMGSSPAEINRLVNERQAELNDSPDDTASDSAARVLQQVYLAVQAGVITADEARTIANRAGAELSGPAPTKPAPVAIPAP